MIPLADQEAIRAKFYQEMVGPVKIDYFTQKDLGLTVPGRKPCAYCKPTGDMLRELAALSPLISLRVHDISDDTEDARKYGIERIPGIVLRGRGEWFVKFYGMPGGTEFPGFLDSLVDISRTEVLFSEESAKALQQVKDDLSIKVFVTPTCPYCPMMARAAYQMSMINPVIKAEVIEVNEFPELGQRYNVEAVPLTVIGDRLAIPGAINEQQLVEQVTKAAASPAAQPSTVRGPSTAATPPPSPEQGQPPEGGEQPGGSGLILP